MSSMVINIIIGLSLLSFCLVNGRLSGWSPEDPVSEDVGSRTPRDADEVEVQGVEEDQETVMDQRTLCLVVARELLRQLLQRPNGRLKRELKEDETSKLVRNSLKLGLMAFMGFLGEEECVERTVCEAGGIMGRYSPSFSVVLTVLDYVVPGYIGKFIDIARDSGLNKSCIYYKCGVLYYDVREPTRA